MHARKKVNSTFRQSRTKNKPAGDGLAVACCIQLVRGAVSVRTWSLCLVGGGAEDSTLCTTVDSRAPHPRLSTHGELIAPLRKEGGPYPNLPMTELWLRESKYYQATELGRSGAGFESKKKKPTPELVFTKH